MDAQAGDAPTSSTLLQAHGACARTEPFGHRSGGFSVLVISNLGIKEHIADKQHPWAANFQLACCRIEALANAPATVMLIFSFGTAFLLASETGTNFLL